LNYEPLVSDQRDQAMLATDKSRLEDFEAVGRQLLALVRQGKPAQYNSFARTQLREAIDKTNASFMAHRAYNIALGDAGAVTAEQIIAAR
jgi:methyl-accepting chemotaxis protein